MLNQLPPPTSERQPHYSFLRPGDFVKFILLIGMTALRFQSAYPLKLDVPRLVSSLGGAVVSLLGLIWYTWLRRKRRHLCEDSGEFIIAALFAPIAFTSVCEQWAEGMFHRGWLLDLGYLLSLTYFGYLVWKAPKVAKEMEALRAAGEEAARHAPAEPRFTHIENP